MVYHWNAPQNAVSCLLQNWTWTTKHSNTWRYQPDCLFTVDPNDKYVKFLRIVKELEHNFQVDLSNTL